MGDFGGNFKLAGSQNWSQPDHAVHRLYLGFFGRPADAGGLEYWLKKISDGMSLQQVASFFSSSPEAQSL
jgi:hypothetical protein